MKWSFRLLDSSVDKNSFDCGVEKITNYFKYSAGQHAKKGISKTFVLASEETREVAGFYSISMSSIPFGSLSDKESKGLPSFPQIPALLIGQLARNKSMYGKGVGDKLLLHAFRKSIELSKEVGVFAIRVDAINEQAKSFYLGYDFIPFIDEPLSLLIPVATIAKSSSN